MAFTSRLGPDSERPGIGLSALIPDPRARVAVSLGGLAVSLWITIGSLPAHPGTTTLTALVVAAVGWLALSTLATARAALPAIAVTAAGGGVIGVADPKGLVFAGIAAGSAGVTFGLSTALALAAVGPAAFALAALAQYDFPGQMYSACTAGLVGLVVGASRREITQRAAHRAEVAYQARRAALAGQEAELAAERNRLARELHDVLAHTLGALSIQLTAIDTLARKAAVPDTVLTQIERGTELIGSGLDEARQAVRALREDTTPLPAQLERLRTLHQADLKITGEARGLDAQATLALYRLAQEALTNAAKHAPGAPVTVRLAYTPHQAELTVHNAAPDPGTPTPLHESGGGFGLAGMRERVLQAGGQCDTGPSEDGGWTVTAHIPYRRRLP
jgi:signal transduction histidine kinase